MSDLCRPAFDVDKWINANVDADIGINEMEDCVNKLTSRFQLSSREISECANENIRSLVMGLPQAMCKLSQINAVIYEISDSLRSLTNSGYQFKTGNVSEKVSELGSLKVRRDMLREASERLKRGLDFESNVRSLRVNSKAGELSLTCLKFSEVWTALSDLSSISRFAGSRSEIEDVQRVLAERIKYELIEACELRNSAKYSKFAELSSQISDERLPRDAILLHFQAEIQKVVTVLNSGGLLIVDWIKPCLDQCKDIIISLKHWIERFRSLLLSDSVDAELIRICGEILRPIIDSQTEMLLASSSFDDLADILRAITDYVQYFNPVRNPLCLCVSLVQVNFPPALEKFLLSHFSNEYQLHKYDTTGTLAKPPESAMRHLAGGTALDATFEPKILSEAIDDCVKAMSWIKVLSQDHSKCARLVYRYFENTVRNLSGKFDLWHETQALEADEMVHLSTMLQIFLIIRDFYKSLRRIEEKEAILENCRLEWSTALEPLQNAAEKAIVGFMSAKPIEFLKDLRRNAEWSAAKADDEMMMADISQSMYMTSVQQQLVGFIQRLSLTNGLGDGLIRRWMMEIGSNLVSACIDEYVEIRGLTTCGQKQLKTDILYLKQLFEALTLEMGKDLSDLLSLLECERKDRENVIVCRSVSPRLAVAVRSWAD
jgi:hypothetical protein